MVGQAVAQYERRSSGSPANDIQYLHRDHQASVVATTNAAGTVRQRWEYDAFGWRTRSLGRGADDTERGYTGHEHLDAVELTHMNGRVQDPELGRFLSADPFVQAPYHSQSLNRYSYVWNNPLTLVDPSGFEGGNSVRLLLPHALFRSDGLVHRSFAAGAELRTRPQHHGISRRQTSRAEPADYWRANP